jgi:hypothetical protein
MDLHIGEIASDVVPVEDARLPEGAELDRLVAATLAALKRDAASGEQARDDTQMWGSVRAGTGR